MDLEEFNQKIGKDDLNKREFFELVKSLRDDYRDEIPSKTLHSWTYYEGGSPPKYKARAAWFQVLYLLVERGKNFSYINGNVEDIIENFQEYAEKTKITQRPTTREDINRANKILDTVVSDLEEELENEDSNYIREQV